MSSQFQGPLHDPNANRRRSTSELWGPWGPDNEDTQPQDFQAAASPLAGQNAAQQNTAHPGEQFAAPIYREHVTGALPANPSEAPRFQPAYNPYPPAMQGYRPRGQPYPPPAQGYTPPVPGYPPNGRVPYTGYPGYQPYPGYPPYPYPYAWQPPKPRRDGYLFAMAIVSLIGSILAVLGGLASAAILLLFAALPHSNLSDSQVFSAVLALVALTLVGLLGGGFSVYHSVRSLMQRPSKAFALPMFWIFALVYLGIVAVGYLLQYYQQEVTFPALTAILILCAGFFPALAFVALGVRRLRNRDKEGGTSIWSTTWRRFIVALTSGATFGLGLALILELGAFFLVVPGQQGIYVNQCLNSNAPNPQECLQPGVLNAIILIFAVIGPLIEEIVKPLAIVLFMGRVRSAAEAFLLGMACGVGFDLVETTLYISSGYHDWLNVALLRSAAGLLHGFGAAMVALGWYYLTHPREFPLGRRLLVVLGCWLYAALQHGIWNGTTFVSLLPAPVGPFLDNWSLNLGITSLSSVVVIYIIEMLLMFSFFLFMTGRLRKRVPPPAKNVAQAAATGKVASV